MLNVVVTLYKLTLPIVESDGTIVFVENVCTYPSAPGCCCDNMVGVSYSLTPAHP
jgi:hypothetical protein